MSTGLLPSRSTGLEDPAYPDDDVEDRAGRPDLGLALLLFALGILVLLRIGLVFEVCQLAGSGCGSPALGALIWGLILLGPAFIAGGVLVLLWPRWKRAPPAS